MFGLVTQRLFVRNLRVTNLRMAHGEPFDDENLTGFKRMFNGETIRGRANFAKLYLSMWAVIFVTWKMVKGKKKKDEPGKEKSE